MPGIDILIGFIGAVVMIFLSKIVMNKLLRRESNYYEDVEGATAATSEVREDRNNE